MAPHSVPSLSVFLVVGCAGLAAPEARAPDALDAPRTRMAGQRASAPVAAAAPVDPPPPTPEPVAPAYDLAADVEARSAAAVLELGPKTLTRLVEDSFLLVGPPGSSSGSFATSVVTVERALAAYFNGRFGRRPERLVVVYLFPSEGPYDAWCRKRWGGPCSSPYGFYLHSERLIVMSVRQGIGTLTHELVHPIVEADFPDAPDWINEGIASLYEQFAFVKPGHIAGYKNWRHPRLLHALLSKHERDHAKLERLFGMTDATFRGDREDLHYAMARYLCQWLDAQGLLWPFYQRWRDTHADDPTGERAFTAVVGKTPADASERWAAWVKRL